MMGPCEEEERSGERDRGDVMVHERAVRRGPQGDNYWETGTLLMGRNSASELRLSSTS